MITDALRKAERSARLAAAGSMGVSPRQLTVLLAEYDRMRTELDRHCGLRHRLWIILGREDGVGLDIELLDAVADAASASRRAQS